MPRTRPIHPRIRIAPATDAERERIARLRHEIFARELGQHPENAEGRLVDVFDASNVYLAATRGDELLGCTSSKG